MTGVSDDAATGAAREAVEEVDRDGTVVGIVTRADVRARRLRHRTVFVAVLDVAGTSLLVHRRAPWKDVWPHRWDIAFGGICGVGETWEAAAARELAEEAGLTSPLVDLGDGTYTDDDVDEVARVFLTRTDDPPTCPDGEVAATDRVPLDAVDTWLTGRSVCPDSVALVRPRLPVIGSSPP